MIAALNTPLAEYWVELRRALTRFIDEHPAASLTARLKARVRVLNFLISRYGDDDSIDRYRPKPPERKPTFDPIHGGRPPLSRERIRELLRSITDPKG